MTYYTYTLYTSISTLSIFSGLCCSDRRIYCAILLFYRSVRSQSCHSRSNVNNVTHFAKLLKYSCSEDGQMINRILNDINTIPMVFNELTKSFLMPSLFVLFIRWSVDNNKWGIFFNRSMNCEGVRFSHSLTTDLHVTLNGRKKPNGCFK